MVVENVVTLIFVCDFLLLWENTSLAFLFGVCVCVCETIAAPLKRCTF